MSKSGSTTKATLGNLRRADSAYLILLVGPLLSVLLITTVPISTVLPSALSTTAFYASIVLLWGSLLFGGYVAIRCRWNKPLFAFGVFAFVLGVTSIVTNVITYFFGLLREGTAGDVSAIASGIATVLYSVGILVLTVVWFAVSRRRWARGVAGSTV